MTCREFGQIRSEPQEKPRTSCAITCDGMGVYAQARIVQTTRGGNWSDICLPIAHCRPAWLVMGEVATGSARLFYALIISQRA